MSNQGDFTRVKTALGIAKLQDYRIREISEPSPFDYFNNALLYISENKYIPFPNGKDPNYILAIANEIEELLNASHGHGAILFTSYKVMDMVWEHLAERALPYPMFRMEKGSTQELDNYKKSGNGVLFASGSMWEGIDIPGDILSMLIVVKLPFAIPDPISEYEQSLYKDIKTYKQQVIIPEMLIKLKQGFGRLIRTEQDSGCVAILDSRCNKIGLYRESVIGALPNCYVTEDIEDIETMMKAKKPREYFK